LQAHLQHPQCPYRIAIPNGVAVLAHDQPSVLNFIDHSRRYIVEIRPDHRPAKGQRFQVIKRISGLRISHLQFPFSTSLAACGL
jgi:hypothetical protein